LAIPHVNCTVDQSIKVGTKPHGQITCITHLWPCCKKDCLGVGLSIEKKEVHKKQVAKFEISKVCKVGKTNKVVLKSDDNGNPRCWLELCLTKTDSCPPAPFPPAVADGSSRPIGCPSVPTAPMTMPCSPFVPSPSPLMQCSAQGPNSAHSGPWTLHAVAEDGKSRIAFGCDNEAKLCCERMDLTTDGCGTVGFSAQGSQIAVACNGIDALADCVTKTDHSVLLRGHVRLCTATENRIHFSRFVDELEITWRHGQLQLHCSWGPDGGSQHPAAFNPVRACTHEEE
jgi:hypothetical protein